MYRDLTGKKYGSFTVVGPDPKSKTRWLCKCNCSNPATFSLETKYLTAGNNPHCGCKTKKRKPSIDKANLYQLYVVQKLSIAKICKMTGLHRNTISKYVREYNLKQAKIENPRPIPQYIVGPR